MSFLPPNQQRQSTEGNNTSVDLADRIPAQNTSISDENNKHQSKFHGTATDP